MAAIMEIIRFALAALLIVCGAIVFGVATLGLFRLKHILSRMHATAKGDTLGCLLMLSGVCLITGLSFTTLKIILAIVFVWLDNPIASFMIGRAEVNTCPRLSQVASIVVVPSKGGQNNKAEADES